jgi:hypothetical protein
MSWQERRWGHNGNGLGTPKSKKGGNKGGNGKGGGRGRGRGGGGNGGGAGSSPDTIASLASWYDFDDPAVLWADTARTVPLTLNNAIRGLTDKGPNGYHLRGTPLSESPIWREDAESLGYADADGTNDHMAAAVNFLTNCATVIMAAYVDSTQDTGAGFFSQSNSSASNIGHVFSIDGVTTNWLTGNQVAGGSLSSDTRVWNNGVQTKAFTVDEARVYSADGTGHPLYTEVAQTFATGNHLFQYRFDFAKQGRGRIYQVATFSEWLSDADRNAVEAWMASKAGVTL